MFEKSNDEQQVFNEVIKSLYGSYPSPPLDLDELIGKYSAKHYRKNIYDAFIKKFIESDKMIELKDVKYGNLTSPFRELLLPFSGDWLAYKAFIKNQRIQDEQAKQLQTDLAKSNIAANKFQKKISTFNLIFFIASIILSILSFVVLLTKSGCM